MFYQIYVLAVKELKIVARDASFLSALFVLPAIFVVIMTFAGIGNQGIRDAKILVVNEDQGSVAQSIINRLKKEKGLIIEDKLEETPISQQKAEDVLLAKGSEYALVMVFPSEFTKQLLAPATASNPAALVKFIADPGTGGQNLNPIERLIKISVMTVAGALSATVEDQIVINAFLKDGHPENQEILQAMNQKYSKELQELSTQIQPRIEFQRVAPKGMTITRPIKAEEQNVPGYTIFGVFFIVQVIGNTILREKEQGTLSRLLAAPISRPVLLLGKLTPFYLVNLIQVIVMFVFGWLVFDINFGNSPLGLLVISLATAAVANALGLFISAISKTTEQMGPLSGVILVSMATAGGIFVPYFEMPKFLQDIAFFTPHAWALKGFQDILVRGYDVQAVLPTAGILICFSIFFYILALIRFRFE